MNNSLMNNVSLKKLNTWRVGGSAEYFIEPETPEALSDFLLKCHTDKKINTFSQITWMGLGSNMLISDAGLAGLVISTAKLNKLYLLGSDSDLDKGANLVYAEAGVSCAKLAKFCAKHNLAGGAFFAGIPGTVGGALAMNAGAFGGETWPLVQQVDVINRRGEVIRKNSVEFIYGYREVACVNVKLDFGFLAGIFKFSPIITSEITSEITSDKREENVRALLIKRNETQPIGTFNCGSVFRNPPGDYAARLIEFCGLMGKKIGGAVVSSKHANFIINENKATAEEIYRLIKEVKETVFKETGVTLIPEVKFLGWQRSE